MPLICVCTLFVRYPFVTCIATVLDSFHACHTAACLVFLIIKYSKYCAVARACVYVLDRCSSELDSGSNLCGEFVQNGQRCEAESSKMHYGCGQVESYIKKSTAVKEVANYK